MGCDIHSTVQIKRDGQWVTVEERLFPMDYPFGGETHTAEPFDWRAYGMFGFLADVRNYSKVPPISEPRGLPEGITSDEDGRYYGDHSFSWLGLDELLAFDYDAYFEDRRCTKEVRPGFFDGAADAGVGSGESKTFRRLLGMDFFRDLAIMTRLDPNPANVRVVFGFDN